MLIYYNTKFLRFLVISQIKAQYYSLHVLDKNNKIEHLRRPHFDKLYIILIKAEIKSFLKCHICVSSLLNQVFHLIILFYKSDCMLCEFFCNVKEWGKREKSSAFSNNLFSVRLFCL